MFDMCISLLQDIGKHSYFIEKNTVIALYERIEHI